MLALTFVYKKNVFLGEHVCALFPTGNTIRLQTQEIR